MTSVQAVKNITMTQKHKYPCGHRSSGIEGSPVSGSWKFIPYTEERNCAGTNIVVTNVSTYKIDDALLSQYASN